MYLIKKKVNSSLLYFEMVMLFVAGHAQDMRVLLLFRLPDEKGAVVGPVVAQHVKSLK